MCVRCSLLNMYHKGGGGGGGWWRSAVRTGDCLGNGSFGHSFGNSRELEKRSCYLIPPLDRYVEHGGTFSRVEK